jgi:hypothetical protein
MSPVNGVYQLDAPSGQIVALNPYPQASESLYCKLAMINLLGHCVPLVAGINIDD